MAHAGGLGGRASASSRHLARSLDAAADATPEIGLWARTILAELATWQDDDRAAEAHFRAALTLGLRDPYLLGAYADFLLDQDRPAEVLALLAGETSIDALLLRLALAEHRLGAGAARDHVDLLRARFDAAARRGDSVHLREQARFALSLLGQPAEALRLALEHWRTQREPADARLVLEAALAVPDAAAAEPVLDWLRRTGLEDARLRALADRLAGGA